MHEASDMELLRQYADENCDQAFAALVSRHVNMVYSAALRKTGNPHAAEEIAQAVFIILAQKAGSLSHRTILSGWLYQTARLTASNFLRGEIRRVQREQEAYMGTVTDETESEAWLHIAPLLEDAMGKLGEKERDAITLRFFKGNSFKEIGMALGVSENASKKRVIHGLEQLRKYFLKRGVVLPVAVLGVAIAANSVHAAPTTLANSITAVAMVKGAAATSSTLTLVKGTVKTLAWLKAKFAVGLGTAVLMIATGVATIALSDNITNSSNAAKAWREVVAAKQPPTPPLLWALKQPSPNDVAQWLANVFQPSLLKSANLARDFYSRFPAHTNSLEARMIEFEQLNTLRESLRPPLDKNLMLRLVALETDLLGNRTLNEKQRFKVRDKQVGRIYSMSPNEFEKYARAFRNDYSERLSPYYFLLRVFEKSDERKARALAEEMNDDRAPQKMKTLVRGLLHRLDSVGHPISIKFTAVDGREVDLSEMQGKVVMVVFWQAREPSPRVVMPEVNAAHLKFQQQGFEVIGISLNRDKSKLASFVKGHGIGWPQYCDGKGDTNRFAEEFGIVNTPVAFLVDKQGNLRDANVNIRQVDAKISQLLAE